MILFLTQYYGGLGHSMRIKHIIEETNKTEKCILVNHLFKPPLDINCFKEYTLVKDIETTQANIFKILMPTPLVEGRIKKLINILNENPEIRVVVSEGFPFCRHQWAYELFTFFDECKKRGIKIICSIRDFPWDEPHQKGLQDWVAKTQNIIVDYYLDKVLVHGDPKVLPIICDAISHYKIDHLLKELESKIVYTGYVVNPNIRKHKRKNNKVIVSCGLNKDESFSIFADIQKVAKNYPDLDFVLIVANKYRKVPIGKKGNLIIVNYIPNLYKVITESAIFITYGGYNSTMEIIAGEIPAIIIPRVSGGKIEQFVRSYVMEPYKLFRVRSVAELSDIGQDIDYILNNESFPSKCDFDLNGAKNSAEEILRCYHN